MLEEEEIIQKFHHKIIYKFKKTHKPHYISCKLVYNIIKLTYFKT